MKIAVYDTYVQRKDGLIMHFDILVPESINDQNIIQRYGHEYIASKPFKIEKLTSNECKFCHIEQATNEIKEDIATKGYSIIEFENCS